MPAKIQSLERGFQILFAVAGWTNGRSVNEIAKQAGLKPITAYKIIRTLEEEHFLKRTEPPLRFKLGHAVHELKRIDDLRFLIAATGKELLKAQRQMPEGNFALLHWDDTDTYQRLAVLTEHYGKLFSRREYLVEPYIKASSLLFLAFANADQVKRFYQKHPFRLRNKSRDLLIWKSKQELENFLKDVRKIGYCQPEAPDRDLFRLAAPIWSSEDELLATVVGFCSEQDTTPEDKETLVKLCLEMGVRLTKLCRNHQNV